ncbi:MULTISPECIES: hypothetical protein [Psychrobacter]|uniref:hypothetical protein n=1 Tax=Psychrobacter TaxID=497 RepID=UPI000EEDF031|nr:MULTISPECIES: hypothetical protein [Psychrobacter]HCH27811.1 hypothetical protein [Psychrobacter sp.]
MANFPHTIFNSIEEITFKKDLVQDFSVEEKDIKLECRINQKVKNEYLVVAPNGAVDRKKYELPVFARWNYQNIFNSSILSISDPALLLDDSLRIGWFAGTNQLDITQFVSEVIIKVADKLGITHDKIIFWGSSSGGFASILLASKIDGSSFVSINGQSAINNYYAGHVEDYRKVFDSQSSIGEILQNYPSRWSIITALDDSYKKGLSTRGIVVQNTIDEMHYLKHYTPFCEHFNVPLEGGKSGTRELWSLLFEHQKGHGPETADIAKRIVNDYFPELLKQ